MTTVTLVRHGEVDNPERILYGRLPDYHLSELGQRMAQRVGAWALDHPERYVHLVSSPLERAQETIATVRDGLAAGSTADGPTVHTDERLIEAGNVFEGKRFGVGDGALRRPGVWWQLRNPFRPSWGEPYRRIVVRMLAAMEDARRAAEAAGGDALVVSHQLPIWTARSYVQGRRLWHDPRARQCALASATGFRYEGGRIVDVWYTEPAADLVSGSATRSVPGA